MQRPSTKLLLLAIGSLALFIFALDTLSDPQISVAVAYVAIVLLSVGFLRRSSVILIAAGCMALALISHFIAPSSSLHTVFVNLAINLTTIAAATYLALRMQRTQAAANEAHFQMMHLARLTAMGELTSALVHELSQPLAAVSTGGEAALRWLAHSPPDVAETRAAIVQLVADAKRASVVVQRIRDLVRKAPATKTGIGLSQLIAETATLMTRESESRSITLHWDTAKTLPFIQGDRIQLQQAIINLWLNAMEAIEAAEGHPREIKISARQVSPHKVAISVADTGIGLDSAHADSLFEAFRTTKPNGLGLGLSITRSIVEAHGGHIRITSNKPYGAIAEMILPVPREM